MEETMTMMMTKGSIDAGHAGPDESRRRAERPRLMSATSPDGHDELRLAEGTRCSVCNEPLRCFPIWLGPHSFRMICEACHHDVISFGRAP
jgi:hypothetical protein